MARNAKILFSILERITIVWGCTCILDLLIQTMCDYNFSYVIFLYKSENKMPNSYVVMVTERNQLICVRVSAIIMRQDKI